jgi:hypothetical protein
MHETVSITNRAGQTFAVLFDAADRDLVAQHRWYVIASSPPGRFYAKCGRIELCMHRLIMGVPEGWDVDHINGDGLDNRRSNLRIVSRADNLRNRTRLNRNNSSGFRGVRQIANGRWRATAHHAGKRRALGCFSTPEEASAAVEAFWAKIPPTEINIEDCR